MMGPWPIVISVGGAFDQDYARIDLIQCFIRVAQLVHRSQPAVINDYIGPLDQLVEQFLSLTLPDVQNDVLLVKMSDDISPSITTDRSAEEHQAIEMRRFDPDGLGTQLSQRTAGIRPD